MFNTLILALLQQLRGLAYCGRKTTAIALLAAALTGCLSAQYNDTVYPYAIKSDVIETAAIKRIVIAHTNLGAPSKKYLDDYSAQIDQTLIALLKKEGYTIVSNQPFQSAWRASVRKYGRPYDPHSSQLNAQALRRVLSATFESLRQNDVADAVLFTDLVEDSVTFVRGGGSRVARWNGVSRKLRYKGSGQISAEFDWSQAVPAVSLRVVIFTDSGAAVFKSVGGLEVSRQVNPRKSSGRFVRRPKLFSNQSNVDEGVALALHPFIKTDGYPEKKPVE